MEVVLLVFIVLELAGGTNSPVNSARKGTYTHTLKGIFIIYYLFYYLLLVCTLHVNASIRIMFLCKCIYTCSWHGQIAVCTHHMILNQFPLSRNDLLLKSGQRSKNKWNGSSDTCRTDGWFQRSDGGKNFSVLVHDSQRQL